MMNRSMILGWLIAGTLGGAAPGLGAEAPKRPSSILEGVPGLEKPVTYTETKIPLGELVRKVAMDTGASLAAVKEVADEPVAVVVREMPARKLLEELAELLDYQWTRRRGDASGSVIWQDLAGKQREEALRHAALQEGEKRFQEQVQRSVEVASMPLEQIGGLWDANNQLQEHLQALSPEQREAFQRSPEARAWRQRMAAATAIAQSPVRQALARLLGALTPEQWATAVRGGRSLVLSTQPRAGELALPAETAQALRASQPTVFPPRMLVSYGNPEAEQQTHRYQEDLQAKWAAAAGYRVTITVDPDQAQTGGSPSVALAAEPVDRDNSSLAPRGGFPGISLSLDGEPLADQPAAGGVPGREGAAMENDPVFGARKSLIAAAKRSTASAALEGRSQWQLQDVLPALAGIYSVQFIADAYWSSSRPVGDPLSAAAPTTLYEVLQRAAKPTHAWDRRGNLVRLRSRSWFFDRPREVPLRLVRRWRELCERYGALPLQEWLENVAPLKDAQLEALSRLAAAAGLPPEFSTIHLSRYGLRLYASLTDTERQALARGQPVPVAQMAAEQRRLFLAPLQARGRPQAASLRPEQLAGGSLSVTRYDFVRVVERRSNSTTYRWDPAPATHGGVHPQAAASRPTAAPNLPGSDSLGASAVTSHPVTQLTLHLQYSPELQEGAAITIPSPAPPGVDSRRPGSTSVGRRAAAASLTAWKIGAPIRMETR